MLKYPFDVVEPFRPIKTINGAIITIYIKLDALLSSGSVIINIFTKKKTIKNIPKRNNCLNLSFDMLLHFNPIYKNKQPNIKIYNKLCKIVFSLI